MQNVALKDILEARFRANPDYELVLFDHLPADQQAILKNLERNPNFYGILRPVGLSGLSLKSVCRDTALLFLTLQQPGRLPHSVTTTRERGNKEIARLVLSGVLSIEWDDRFVSGPEAAPVICEHESLNEGEGTLARLSVEALKYGQALEISDPARLSVRLYLYNRTPLSPYWKRIFPSSDAVVEQLGIHRGVAAAMLEEHWLRAPGPVDEGWLAWESKRIAGTGDRKERKNGGYKLYVSPQAEFLRQTFEATLEVLMRAPAHHFKIGRDALGVLRPDKFVVYFDSFKDLLGAADQLQHMLSGCSAHGVPFTAELTGDGLLSWGMDPPPEEMILGWQWRESWRLWVTNQLATALIAARGAASSGLAPWQFAIKRLQLEGVDIASWAPTHTIWQERSEIEV